MAFALARGDHARPSPRVAEPLSQSEARVLRYLPTNLSAREIARELSVSLNTVRTHMRHLFAKLACTAVRRLWRGPAPSACSHRPPACPEVFCARL